MNYFLPLYILDADFLPSPSAVPPVAFRKFFWNLLMELVPRALSQPTTSLEAFNLAVMIYKDSAPFELDLHETVPRLSKLLREYTPLEVPGMALALPRGLSEEPFPGENLQLGTIDLGAHGLVTLLHCLLCEDRQESVADDIPRE